MAGAKTNTTNGQPQNGKGLAFTQLSRLMRARAKEYSLQSIFKYGYRNKEDISNLPPQTLVVGSQNVLTNAAELVGIRQGYVLDGSAGNQNNYGVDSSYDFLSRQGNYENLRKWGANLEVRYVNPVTKIVSWINILSSLNASNVVNFTNFWDAITELKMFCLFCNGGQTVYEWSGGVGSVASTSNSSGIIGGITANPNVTANDSGGVNYAVGDVLTITGGAANAQVTVGAVTPGGVGSISIANAGSGGSYLANDIIKITPNNGGQAAFAKVLTVAGSQVATIQLLTAGSGFYVGNVCATTDTTTGSATGLTLNILTTGNTITQWTLTTNGTGYSAANNIATTGGSGTGATVQINSVATNSITVSGTKTLSQLGFYDQGNNSGKFQLLINGTTYTYTGSNANGGFTFVGINTDPTVTGISVGDAVIQIPVTGAISGGATAFLPTGFTIDLISTLDNQIWYGSETTSNVYVSKTNDYTTVAFSTPARLPAEGALITLDAPPVGFFPQSSEMYISAGRDQWWISQKNQQTVTVSTVATPTETLYATRLKTARNQAAQSQGLIGQFKNSLVFVSNEQIVNALGLVKDIQIDPQVTNMSDPIKYDIEAYDFTGGQVLYDNYFIYITIPKQGVVRMYNVVKQYWEAPQVLPVSRFYRITEATGIYGHSSLTNESYQMFTGYNDNGNPINAVAAFPYTCVLGGAVNEKKSFNKFYTEGYISSNTVLSETINYDFGGFSGTYTAQISGNQGSVNGKRTIFNKVTDGSLGQNTLGSQPIGTILNLATNNPKFRIINTMPRLDIFEYQVIYSTNDIDCQWSILRFGSNISSADAMGNEITI